MKLLFVWPVFLVLPYLVLGQNDMECKLYLKKSKICFLFENTSDDTLHFSLKLQDFDFWNNPVMGKDFFVRNDTLVLNLLDHAGQSIQSNGEPLYYQINGERWHTKIYPGHSYSFFLKIINAKEIYYKINHISILGNWETPKVRTTRVVKNGFRIEFRPVKF